MIHNTDNGQWRIMLKSKFGQDLPFLRRGCDCFRRVHRNGTEFAGAALAETCAILTCPKWQVVAKQRGEKGDKSQQVVSCRAAPTHLDDNTQDHSTLAPHTRQTWVVDNAAQC